MTLVYFQSICTYPWEAWVGETYCSRWPLEHAERMVLWFETLGANVRGETVEGWRACAEGVGSTLRDKR